MKHKLDKTALRIFEGIYKKYAPVFKALAYNEVKHMVHRIKPLYKSDSFGRPLSVNVDKASWRYGFQKEITKISNFIIKF